MIHAYCGDGKGKTTAAFGMALRAVAAGWNVCVVQFLKGGESGEVELLSRMPGVTVLRGKAGTKFSFQMNDEERAEARKLHDENLARAIGLMEQGQVDLLVLDEAAAALRTGLLDEAAVRRAIELAGDTVEVVVTGREPAQFLLDAADYITNMHCERHPAGCGIMARKGVEF